jgi:hypothetical protein
MRRESIELATALLIGMALAGVLYLLLYAAFNGMGI